MTILQGRGLQGTEHSELLVIHLFLCLIKILDATLKYLCNSKCEFLVCGDINIDYLNDYN